VWLRATSGQFRLSFGGSTTSDLPFDASSGEVEPALNALFPISSGGGSVSVEGGVGGIAGTTPSVYVVRFEGALAGTEVPELAASNGTAPLGGGTPSPCWKPAREPTAPPAAPDSRHAPPPRAARKASPEPEPVNSLRLAGLP